MDTIKRSEAIAMSIREVVGRDQPVDPRALYSEVVSRHAGASLDEVVEAAASLVTAGILAFPPGALLRLAAPGRLHRSKPAPTR